MGFQLDESLALLLWRLRCSLDFARNDKMRGHFLVATLRFASL